MSIALSAFVRPSRTARHLLACWALAQCAAALAVVCASPARYAGAAWIAGLLACAGLALGGAALRRPKTHRIDISGTGELRVTVQQNVRMPGPVPQAPDGNVADIEAVPLVLLPGSVLWPGLMVLRLGASSAAPPAAPFWLPVWRDSVEGDAWRALAVALAVIGRPGRAEGGFENNR
jgi:toxin CptA